MAKITLNAKQTKAFLDYIKSVSRPAAAPDGFRSYMMERDRHYARIQSKEEKAKAEYVIPLVLGQLNTAKAKLENTFTTNRPIFRVVSPPAMAKVAEQYDAIYEADATRYGWASELAVSFLDGLKYNLMAAEVTWEVETISTQTNDPEAVRPEVMVLYQGNKVSRIGLYNALWDTSVRPRDVHVLGDYAGYYSLYTAQRLTNYLLGLGTKPSKMEDVLTLNGNYPYKGCWFEPNLDPEAANISPTESAARFDESADDIRKSRSKTSGAPYEALTLYMRAIPADFHLGKHPHVTSPDAQSIFKVVVINGQHIVYCEQLQNKHNYLPIVFGQPLDEGLGYGSKSFTHNLEDLQQIATMFISAEIKSNRRMITDRGIYDPLLLDKRAINSPNPSAKIPIRTSAFGRGINEAYLPIPYEDRALGTRVSQAMSVLSFSTEINGLNKISGGNFVKGNKTDSQFQESMASSEQRILSMAVNLEDSFMSAIKEITKQNILQYQPADEALSEEYQRTITIDPVELKKLNVTFRIADGLISADRLANTAALSTAIQYLSTPGNPLAGEYKVADMVVHLLSLQGIKHLSQYKYTDAEKQAMQQQAAQAQAAATNGQQPQAGNPAQQGQLNGNQ